MNNNNTGGIIFMLYEEKEKNKSHFRCAKGKCEKSADVDDRDDDDDCGQFLFSDLGIVEELANF